MTSRMMAVRPLWALMGAAALVVLLLMPPADGTQVQARPLAVALRNCSRIPAAEAARFAFTAAAGSKLQWQSDTGQCLTPAAGGPNSTGVQLQSCDNSTGWDRVPVPNATGFTCSPYESCLDGRPCPASGVCAPLAGTSGTGGFFLSPSANRSLCLRAQPNWGAALLIPCHADPWNRDPWHYAPINDSRVYCPQHGGTIWRLAAGGQLRASMSNAFQIGADPAVCAPFEGCLGAAALPSGTIRPLRWKPVPLSVPLRPTEGGWMHQQLVAQANGFGGHEYPFSNSNPMMHTQNRYYPFANYS